MLLLLLLVLSVRLTRRCHHRHDGNDLGKGRQGSRLVEAVAVGRRLWLAESRRL